MGYVSLWRSFTSKKPCIHQGYGAFVILTKKGPFTRPMKRPKQAEKLQKSPVQKKGCTGDFVISRRRCDGVGGVGGTHRSRPTDGYRFRVPFHRAWRWRLGRTESSAPTQGLPMPGAIHPGGGGGRCRVWRDTQVPPYGGYCHRLPFDRPGGYRPLIRPCGATFSPRRRLGVGGTFSAAGSIYVADNGTMSAHYHPHTFPQKERAV